MPRPATICYSTLTRCCPHPRWSTCWGSCRTILTPGYLGRGSYSKMAALTWPVGAASRRRKSRSIVSRDCRRLFPRSRRFGQYNLTYLDPSVTAEVDSVVGAFMLVRAEAIQAAGLLDESFFMYGEDLDWAYRIKAAGWRVYYNADVTVLHCKRAASRA